MPFDDHSNFGYSTVTVAPAPANSGTSLTVGAGEGALFPTAPFNCTVWPSGVLPLASNAEIVRVTAIVGDVFTITRAQEGTVAINIAVGYQIANTTSVKVFTDIETDVTTLQGDVTTLQGDVATAQGDITTLQTGKQNVDAVLTDLSSLVLVQGDILYYDGANLTRLAAGVAGRVLQTQGAGANPQWAAVGAGDLLAANNLSDVANASTSRTNLGLAIGTNVQAQDVVLQDLADAALVQGDVLYYNGTNLVRLGAGTSGQFLQTLGAGANPQWADASGGGGGSSGNGVTYVRKTADQTVTNNATPQNDTELFLSLDANGFYLIELELLFCGNSTSGDFRFRFTFPATVATVLGYVYYSDAGGTTQLQGLNQGTSTTWPSGDIVAFTDSAASVRTVKVQFQLLVAGAGGTLQFQFANGAAALGRDSTCKAGSLLKVTNLLTVNAGGGGDWDATVVKSADQTVTNNTTPQNDSELFVPLQANSLYLVELLLLYSGNSTSGDYRGRFSHPDTTGGGSTTGWYNGYNSGLTVAMTSAGAASGTAWPASDILLGTVATTAQWYPAQIQFLIRTTAASGNLQYQFANISGGVGVESVTKAGSTLRVRRLDPSSGGGSGGGGDTISTGTYASRPAAGNDGNLYLPSDGITTQRDSGSAWVPWGPIWPFTQPINADYSWVNQGGATITDNFGVLHLVSDTPAATQNLRCRVKTAPATPYTITAAMMVSTNHLNSGIFGLMFRESGTGEISTMGVAFNSISAGGGDGWLSSNYTNETTFSANNNSLLVQVPNMIWLRITDDGVNRVYQYSYDGLYWQTLYSVGRTTFLTADQVGFFLNASFANPTPNVLAVLTLFSWKQT